MEIHTVQQQLKSRNIYEIPLRVTFYARVSSESDEQLNSLGNQISYYEDLISKNSQWVALCSATVPAREKTRRHKK
ncbi:hypothetical protein FACS189425_10410 [Clostridia bacterium]|nr:hypothetical protein FACS189425_10410 [Clostridia bacterium]